MINKGYLSRSGWTQKEGLDSRKSETGEDP
jgi:hypothetical protein